MCRTPRIVTHKEFILRLTLRGAQNSRGFYFYLNSTHAAGPAALLGGVAPGLAHTEPTPIGERQSRKIKTNIFMSDFSILRYSFWTSSSDNRNILALVLIYSSSHFTFLGCNLYRVLSNNSFANSFPVKSSFFCFSFIAHNRSILSSLK